MPNPVLQRLVDERTQTYENIDRILDAANEEERDPTESERELITRHRARIDQLEPQIGELLDLEETRERSRDARAALTRATPSPAVGDLPKPDSDDDGELGEYRHFAHYARDVILTRFDQVGASVSPQIRQRAQQRLERAVAKVLTSDVPGIVITQYLTQIMQRIDASRPLVDAANRIGLTSGKLQFPEIQQRPTVAKQAAQKTEAGDGTLKVGMTDVTADTYLVAGNFSWQVINWANPDALRLWFDLAAADYAKKTDAAAGALLAAHDSTPTVVAAPGGLAEWMAAIAAAAGEVYANTDRYANVIAANPADAYKLVGLVSQASPVFLATGPANLATGTFPSIAGLRFVASAGLPAGTVIVGDFSTLLCAETAGSPVELRAVEPSIGGIEVGIIGAFACAITDPGAFAEITAP